jgi:hypothetical protein
MSTKTYTETPDERTKLREREKKAFSQTQPARKPGGAYA